ncbi:archaeal/vacuolar-type H+-ATPase subunit I [Halovivax ruber XH-70]|uniref:A-type ATP synthase subunit I n=1 Tax=Halovivax ruber (strain DSM 18193 / JCM 13892 / XH-70) TaxID=797302 RepID=L0IE97_HALRX|nr:V-type ATP synthase subunit I [Halovivax ruber]AGB17163.1 archaeal/vacuolar-type H+-ATPase subunit I [Halovivax ruber XH-70]
MFRPERMAKVSVTGARAVMPDVIETLHELGLVHLSDYDGSWDGFDNGDPIEGAEEASEKLVTVRALESTLDVTAEDVAPQPTLPDDWETRLADLRDRVNELDDEGSALRDERREVVDRIDRLAPFAALGIDLDLLSGYESIDLVVGEGDRAEIEAELGSADEIRAFETFATDGVVAIAAAPATDEAPTEADTRGLVADALVSVEFTNYEVPDVDETPAAYLDDLETRRDELDRTLTEIETELAELATDRGPFLRRVERELTVDVDRAEAPLRFATTEHAFVAEGWIPAERFDAFEASLRDTAGESVEIEELEIADYEEHAHGNAHEVGDADEQDRAETGDRETQSPESAAEEEPEPAKATDGGTTVSGASGAVTMDEDPPVVMDNLTPAKPFEMMVKMVGQPKYSELDPTFLVFLTYPIAFGFMIGDIGYGLLYMALGYGLWKGMDSSAGKALGTIGIWAGAFTAIFGYLYGELFGTHLSYLGIEGLPLMESLAKGLQSSEWALFWIVISLVFGLIHLNLGLLMGFFNELKHGLKAALYEKFSWILGMNGLFIWIFSHQDAGSFDHGVGFLPGDMTFGSMKPAFLAGATDQAVLYDYLGFAGFPELVGILGLIAMFVGLVMVGIGEGATGLVESPAWMFGHVLSYLRLTAVLLAKAGMAFAVNLLVWGGYSDGHGHTVFNLPTYDVSGYEMEFVGLIHLGDGPLVSAIAIVAGILVLVFGHVLVLILGITSAGIQMLRLEWVEFYQKFYEGGGEEYEPFGRDVGQTAD